MIDTTYKPTGWEERGQCHVRRASVWPTVLLFASNVPSHGGGFLWTAELGAPGICIEHESDHAATPEEARAAADRLALRWINEARARIDEALGATPDTAAKG